MEKENFKYDVAFSFLEEDEQLATKINDLLTDQLSTFLYYERQKEIAGTDGEKTLNDVFGKESRIVVVLYREKWGSTSWTRIEEIAIRNRAYDEGYDFVIFVPLDTPPKTPEWLPRTQIWIGLDRWGIEGAASVIESRVQQAGGSPQPETIHNHAARLKRQREFQKKRKDFLYSKEGVNAAVQEVKDLLAIIKERSEEISESIAIQVHEPNKDIWTEESLYISSSGYWVSLYWQLRFTNTLKGSKLNISVLKGYPPTQPGYSTLMPRRLSSEEFEFDIDINEKPYWKLKYSDKDFTTHRLAEYFLKLLIDRIEKGIFEKD